MDVLYYLLYYFHLIAYIYNRGKSNRWCMDRTDFTGLRVKLPELEEAGEKYQQWCCGHATTRDTSVDPPVHECAICGDRYPVESMTELRDARFVFTDPEPSATEVYEKLQW